MILVLASNSPRRKQLLALAGWDFMLLPVDVDERPHSGEEALGYVLRLAEGKARAAAAQVIPETVVIAADTTVVADGAILGKPADADEAEVMLRRLRGRVHQVYTALAVMQPEEGIFIQDWCLTNVPMRDYSDNELLAYIASGDPLDKAGAYAIQHAGFHPVETIQGCYANVMGLPLCHLVRTLRTLGITPQTDVPQACQLAISYQCPIYQQVLQRVV